MKIYNKTGKFPKKDLRFKRFHKKIVLDWLGRNKFDRNVWLYGCDCGNTGRCETVELKRTKSCGCYRLEKNVRIHKKHGGTKTKLYQVWRHMKQRCYKTYDIHYMYYGGKGIKVCEE